MLDQKDVALREAQTQLRELTTPAALAPAKLIALFTKHKLEYPLNEEVAATLTGAWGDGKPHEELDVLPLLVHTPEETVWLLWVLKQVGADKTSFNEASSAGQMHRLFRETLQQYAMLCHLRLRPLVDCLVQTPFFDPCKSVLEEGLALAVARVFNDVWTSVTTLEWRFSALVLRQIMHTFSWTLINAIVDSDGVCGLKGFQLNFFYSCLERSIAEISKDLRTFTPNLNCVLEFSRLLTLPITSEILADKAEIFPSLPDTLLPAVLARFRPDELRPAPSHPQLQPVLRPASSEARVL